MRWSSTTPAIVAAMRTTTHMVAHISSHAITRRSLALWVPIIQQLLDVIQPLQDVREHLVSPLPKDCRLTVRSPYPGHREILKFLIQAILDACYSAMLLNLEHYTCHCFIRRRSQCMLCSALRLPSLTPSQFSSCFSWEEKPSSVAEASETASDRSRDTPPAQE